MLIKQKRGPDVYMEKISYNEYRNRTNQPSYWYNLTPHPITLVVSEIPPRTIHDIHRVLCVIFPPYGKVARVAFDEPKIEIVDGFKIHHSTPIKEIADLPPAMPNVYYVVSALVREQLRGSNRTDVFSPDTGATAIRNDKGAVFAVRAFQKA